MIQKISCSYRLEAVNYYHKALHLGCCSSPVFASVYTNLYCKTSRKFYQQFTKNKLKSAENEQVPGLIIRKGKFCQLCRSYLNIIFGRTD